MAEDVPRNAGSPTEQHNSAAALICAAHGFFCSSPSCLLQGWGNLATQRALVSQPSASVQHTQQIESSTALSLTRPFHCAVDITQRKSGKVAMHWNAACDHAGLENWMYMDFYTHTVSHSTPSLLQSCLCASYIVPLAQWVCAEPTLKPGPSPPPMIWGWKSRELQPSAASDMLQFVSLAASRRGNMHQALSPFHSSQGTGTSSRPWACR